MNVIYNRFLANLMNKEVDLEGDNIRIALMDTNHTPTATDDVWADVSANEISGTGYTANGELLAGKAVTQGATTKWDADNVSWADAIFSAFHAVIYDDSLVGDDLIASIDFGGEIAINDGTFSIVFDAAGIITLSE